MKKIIFSAIAVISILSFQSCLKNQVDYFDKTAASRMTYALEQARTALYSSENGWKMEYFTYNGGYNFAVKFVDKDAKGNPIDSVCATSELAPSKMSGSYFRLTSDDGPVLSFDTYNDILHYFGTPDWSNYQGHGGDFEFIILSASQDEIVLKGKRTGLISRMTPIEAPETMQSYAAKMADVAENFLVVSATGATDGVAVKMDIDLTSRNVILTAKDEEGQWDEINAVQVPYLITTNGFKFERVIKFQGHEIEYFTYNKNTRRLLADDEDLVFKADAIPSDYVKFSEYPGEYEFKYATDVTPGTATVTIEVVDELSKIVQMKGFTTDYEGIYLYYNATSGRLQYLPQYVGTYNDEFPIAGFTMDGRNVSTSATMDLAPDPTSDKGFKFVSTPDQKMKVTGIILFKEFTTEDGETDYEQFSEWNPSMLYPKTLTRK